MLLSLTVDWQTKIKSQVSPASLTTQAGKSQAAHANTTDPANALRPEELAQSQEKRLESLIAKKLASFEFKAELTKLETEEQKKALASYAIEYLLLHKDGFKFKDNITKLSAEIAKHPKNVSESGLIAWSELLLESIREKVNASDSDQAVIDYINQEVHDTGFMYHSFNGESLKKKIQKEGLNVSERLWDWNDFERIKRIEEITDSPFLVGFGNFNSKDLIALGADPKNLYTYAEGSPEWMKLFCANSAEIRDGLPTERVPLYADAFINRNYEGAKANLEDFLQECLSIAPFQKADGVDYVSEEDADFLRQFFEKSWQALAIDISPCLALVKRQAVKPNLPRFNSKDELFDKKGFGCFKKPLEQYLLHSLRGILDYQVDYNISAKDMLFVDLPSFA